MLNEKQQEVVNKIDGPMMVLSTAGSGKEQPVDIVIPTPRGRMRFGNLKVGDYIYDRKGNPTKIIGIFPQGKKKDVYKMTFSDSRSSLCGLEHLWTYTENDTFITKSLKELLIDYKDKKYLIPNNLPVQNFIEKFHSNPYDSGFSIGSMHVTSDFYKNCIDFEKGSFQDRMYCLQGLLDSDNGYVTDDFNCLFKSEKKELIDAVRSLCWSLAIKTKYKMMKFKQNTFHYLELNIDNENKLSFCNEDKKTFISKYLSLQNENCNNDLFIKEIEKLPEQQEMMCIKVDNEEELYLTTDYIVTHNTTTVIHRMANLISKDISPKNILGLTFSNKAANELTERVFKIIGDKGKYITTKTFHAFGLQLLRTDGDKININKDFTIKSSEKDKTNMIHQVLDDLNLTKKYGKKNDAKDIRKCIDKIKINGIMAGNFLESDFDSFPFNKQDIYRIYIKYQEKLKNINALDFGDILLQTIRLLENKEVLEKYQNIFKYIFIDEYQDLNKVQYKIMKELAMKYKNICVVGDLDQRIYSFQGAHSKTADQFIEDFPEYTLIKMEQNYRSIPSILKVANELIKNNTKRIPTEMWTENESTDLIDIVECENHGEEIDYIIDNIAEKMQKNPNIKYSDFSILYRLNRTSVIESKLKHKKIPFVIGSKENLFYNQEEVKNILSYLRIVHNNNDEDAISCNLNIQRGLGSETVNKLKARFAMHNIPFLEIIRENVKKNPQYLCKNIERQIKPLQTFLTGIDYFIEFANNHSLEEIIDEIVGYSSYVLDIVDRGGKENVERYDNILELQKEIKLFVEKCKNNNVSHTVKDFLNEVDFLLTEEDPLNEQNGVVLSSIHKSKGREFESVYLTSFDDYTLPIYLAQGSLEEFEEERRLAYVAITRAKKNLTISYCRKRRDPFKNIDIPVAPSSFLSEIPMQFCNYLQL